MDGHIDVVIQLDFKPYTTRRDLIVTLSAAVKRWAGLRIQTVPYGFLYPVHAELGLRRSKHSLDERCVSSNRLCRKYVSYTA